MTITKDEWLKALHDAGIQDDVDDPDAVTAAEFAAMLGLPRLTAERRLKVLEAAGAATRTRKRGRTRDGRTFSFVAYRLTAKPTKKPSKAAR